MIKAWPALGAPVCLTAAPFGDSRALAVRGAGVGLATFPVTLARRSLRNVP